MSDDWARPVVHIEIGATDPERMRTFYRELFHWEIAPAAGPLGLMNFPAGLGGPEPGPGGHIQHSDRPGVTLYIQVLDLQATLDRAVALGGTAIIPPFQVPNGPGLAGITDPEGNRVMLVAQ